MSDQQTPPDWSSTSDSADDIAQLRERLAFYESFDKLIQENISRAGDLLREAAAKKGETELALRNESAALQEQQLSERVKYRRLFASLLDQITTVQQNVEQLARDVSDALDDLESQIPAAGELSAEGGELPPLPRFVSTLERELSAGTVDWQQQTEARMEPVDELSAGASAAGETESTAATTAIDSNPSFAAVVSSATERISQEYGSSDRQPAPDDEPLDRDEPVEAASDEIDELPFDVEPEEPFGGDAAGTSTEEESVPADGSPATETSEEPGQIDAFEAETGGDPQLAAEQPAQDADEEPIAAAESPADENGEGEMSPLERYRTARGGELASTEAAPAPEPAAEGDTGEGPSTDLVDEAAAWSDEPAGISTTLLVHNVPRATTALSLKRYLEGLEAVHAVEPREYAEGVLRLQLSSDRLVGLDDLRNWPEAAGLESISEGDDFVEVRLAP